MARLSPAQLRALKLVDGGDVVRDDVSYRNRGPLSLPSHGIAGATMDLLMNRDLVTYVPGRPEGRRYVLGVYRITDAGRDLLAALPAADAGKDAGNGPSGS